MEYEYIIGIGIYLAVMLAVGFWVKNKNKTAEDYLVAGRSFGMFRNTATLCSCTIAGTAIMAYPGTLYSFGFWSDELLWGGMVLIFGVSCIVFAGLFYMPKLWRMKLLTLGDFFYVRYGRSVGIMTTCLFAFTFAIWVAVQMLVFAKVVGVILGWDFMTSIFVATSVICIYTLMGGLYAVAYTDIIQVALVIIGLLILTPVAIGAVGGWDALVDGTPGEKLQLIPHVASGNVILAYIGGFVIIALGSITSPDFMQRAYSAKSPAVARNSALASALVSWSVYAMVTCLTFAGIILIGDGVLSADIVNEDPELILPLMFKTIMPTALVVLFVGAILAAVMSAADSSLLALAGMLSKNIVKDVFKPDLNDHTLMRATQGLVLVIGILALIIATSLPSVVFLIALGFDLILCCLFGPFTLGLYYKKANGYGALAGMAVGVFCRVIVAGCLNGFSMENLILIEDWYVYTIFSPIACIVTMVIVSELTQKKNPPIPIKYYDA